MPSAGTPIPDLMDLNIEEIQMLHAQALQKQGTPTASVAHTIKRQRCAGECLKIERLAWQSVPRQAAGDVKALGGVPRPRNSGPHTPGRINRRPVAMRSYQHYTTDSGDRVAAVRRMATP